MGRTKGSKNKPKVNLPSGDVVKIEEMINTAIKRWFNEHKITLEIGIEKVNLRGRQPKVIKP